VKKPLNIVNIEWIPSMDILEESPMQVTTS